MATAVFYIIHTAGRIFRAQHVRRGSSGKLPPMSGRTRKRRTSSTTSQKGQTNGKKTEE